MSHAATKWAFDQPELHADMKPSEWAVLMVLADCHNPVYGCFPSQEFICRKTNLAERAVRDQLGKLRDRGLIDWDEAREKGRRGANRYRLAFEGDFGPAPEGGDEGREEPREEAEKPPANSAGGEAPATGKNAQVQPANSDSFYRQNLPPNPVIEPVRESLSAREAPEREVDRSDLNEQEARSAATGTEQTTDAPEGLSKRAEALFFASFKHYDRFDVSPKKPMLAAWGRLSWAEMNECAPCVPRYIARCRAEKVNHAPAISTFLDEKLWKPFVGEAASHAPERLAPYGKQAMARRSDLLNTLAPRPWKPTAIQQRMIDAGKGWMVEPDRRRAQWPEVAALDEAMMAGRSVSLPPDVAVSETDGMVTVARDTAEWQACAAWHAAQDWPWIDPPAHVRFVWVRREWLETRDAAE